VRHALCAASASGDLLNHDEESTMTLPHLHRPHQDPSAEEPTVPRREPNRWAILALLCVAQLMVTLDVTIVNIALPSAQRALHFSTESRQWIITAYAFAFGSLLLGGKLGHLFGRKPTCVAGLIGFSVASVLGGQSHSFEMLVAARALQGAFAALLAPSALSLLTVTFAGSPDRPIAPRRLASSPRSAPAARRSGCCSAAC
jgi:sugar phosphate permease